MARRVIGTATVNVQADTSQFRSALSGLGSGLAGSFGRLRRLIGGLGLGHLAREALEFGATYRIQLDNAAAAVVGLTGANNASGASMEHISKFASGATHSLEGLSGAERDAATLLKEMTDFAIATPFDLPGVQSATQRLLAFGEGFGVTNKNVVDYVGIIGDAAASTGQGADAMNNVVTVLGKISGQGRVLRRDMNQLTANFPSLHPWEILSEETGVTVENLQRMSLKPGGLESIISGDEAVRAFIEGMKEMPGAAGAMERRMQTLGGTFEVFKDTLGVSLAEGLRPFFKAMQDIMKNEKVRDSIQALAEAFGEVVTAVVDGLGPVLPQLIDSFALMVTALLPAAPAIGQLAVALSLAFVQFAPLINILAQLAAAVGNFMMKLNPQALGIITAALLTLYIVGFGWVGVVVALVVALAMTIRVNWDTITEYTQKMVDGIVAAWQWLFDNVIDPVQNFVMTIVNFFQMLYEWLVGGSIIPDMVNAIIRWFGILSTVVLAIVNAIKAVIIAVWNAIKTAVTVVVQAIVTVITLYFNIYKTIITTYINAIKFVVTTVFNAIKVVVTTVLNGIKTVVTTVWNGIKAVTSTVWNAIKTAITSPIEAAKSVINGIVSFIRGLFNFSGLSSIVSGVFNGIKNAIIGPIQSAYERVSGIISNIRNAISNIPGAGVVGNAIGTVGGWLGFGAEGAIIRRPGIMGVGEAGPEALIPLSNPMRAMQLMQQSGLDRLAAQINRPTFAGPIVSMPGATIQDATDADLVAQRTLVAITAQVVS